MDLSHLESRREDENLQLDIDINQEYVVGETR